MSVQDRAFCILLSLLSLGAGLFIASAHPVAPFIVTAVFLCLSPVFFWRPQLGLWLLPVFLPFLNFSPWTGWIVVDESDLLVLGIVAAGYLRMQRNGIELAQRKAFLCFLVATLLLIVLGLNDFSLQSFSWFSGYTSPLNAFRVGKSLLWIVLLFPLVTRLVSVSSGNKASAEFFCVYLVGSFTVVLAALWERSFYPGLLDFATSYRTVSLFWEMHQGGAALDAYLVMIAPLSVWAWRTTVSTWFRLALGTFILVFVYVCLTTFSRGVFVAILGSTVLLCSLLAWPCVKGRQAVQGFNLSTILMLFLIALEIGVALSADSFMSKRFEATQRDFGGRLEHWAKGVGLLKTPGDWLFGIGLGRLPARMTQGEDSLALPGGFHGKEHAEGRSMEISGPNGINNNQELGGLFAISQRVELIPRQRYQFAMDLRSEQDAEILAKVCAIHLLYPAICQARRARLNSGEWRHWESMLSGYTFLFPSWQRVGHGVFSLSVLTMDARIEVTNLYLSVGGKNLLRNPQFLEEEASWFPAARSYFLPWHIDSLYLEILIEAGLVGLFGFLAVVFVIGWRLFLSYLQGDAYAPYYLSCIAGLMCLGLVVSVIDMPRVSTLFGLLLVLAWRCSVLEAER